MQTPPNFLKRLIKQTKDPLLLCRVLSSYLNDIFMAMNHRWYLLLERDNGQGGGLCRGAGTGMFGSRHRVLGVSLLPLQRDGAWGHRDPATGDVSHALAVPTSRTRCDFRQCLLLVCQLAALSLEAIAKK